MMLYLRSFSLNLAHEYILRICKLVLILGMMLDSSCDPTVLVSKSHIRAYSLSTRMRSHSNHNPAVRCPVLLGKLTAIAPLGHSQHITLGQCTL